MALSKIRSLSLEITNDLYNIGKGYVKHQLIFNFFSRFFKPRLDNIISNEIPEEELKKIMWACKGKLDKAFSQLDTVQKIKESQIINDPVMTRNLMKLPDFQKLEELF